MVKALRGRIDGPVITEEVIDLKEGDDLYWMEVQADEDENGITDNVFCPTGIGGGVDPSCSPGGGGVGRATLPTPENINVIKTLPGSTNPKLVLFDGNKYVMKTDKPGYPGRLTNEHDADSAYAALGINASDSIMSGGAKFAKYMEGGQNLHEWKEGKSESEIQAMYKEIGKGFVADAVLANWDVVGLVHDNILIKDGKPWRIDNGGALKYRAQGGEKGFKFNDKNSELQTLRDMYMNPSAAKVFGHLKEKEIYEQIKEILPKKDQVLKAIKDLDTRAMVAKRFENLKDVQLKKYKEAADMTASPVTPPATPPPTSMPASTAAPFIPPKIAPAPSKGFPSGTPATAYGMVHSLPKAGKDVVAYLVKNKGKVPLTALYQNKLEALNPDGIKGGIWKIPTFPPGEHSSLKKVELMQKLLPPGTVIKQASITAKALAKKIEAGKVKLSTISKKVAAHITYVKGDKGVTYTLTTPGHDPTKFPMHGYTPKAGDFAGGFKTSNPSKWQIDDPWSGRMYTVQGGTAKAPDHTDGGLLFIDHTTHHPDIEQQKAWKASLTEKEKNAIGHWKGSSSTIRASVASGNPSPEAKAFMSGIEKSAPFQGVIYRGVHGSYAENLATQLVKNGIGGLWSDPAPHNCSINPYIGFEKFGGKNGITFRIKSKTARPDMAEHNYHGLGPHDENEIVGLPGTKYKVIGLHENLTVNGPGLSKDRKVRLMVDLEEL
jgi:hypothetical protein